MGTTLGVATSPALMNTCTSSSSLSSAYCSWTVFGRCPVACMTAPRGTPIDSRRRIVDCRRSCGITPGIFASSLARLNIARMEIIGSRRDAGPRAVVTATARGSGRSKMNEQRMQTRTTLVLGRSVVVHSFDGQRWFSDAREAQQCEKRREEFFTERAKSLKRSDTFAIGTVNRTRAR